MEGTHRQTSAQRAGARAQVPVSLNPGIPGEGGLTATAHPRCAMPILREENKAQSSSLWVPGHWYLEPVSK